VLLCTMLQTIKYSELKEVERFAEGGFGVVYLAKHPHWNKVAYKELKISTMPERTKFVYYYSHIPRDVMLVWYMLSSCVQSQAGTVPKRLSIASRKERDSAGTHSFLMPNVSTRFQWGHPNGGAI